MYGHQGDGPEETVAKPLGLWLRAQGLDFSSRSGEFSCTGSQSLLASSPGPEVDVQSPQGKHLEVQAHVEIRKHS